MKNFKTVLGQEREREKAERERRRQVKSEAGEQAPQDTMNVDGETNRVKAVEEDEETPTCMFRNILIRCGIIVYPITDTSIEAPPSIWPQKRYCDITGLEVHFPLFVTRRSPI